MFSLLRYTNMQSTYTLLSEPFTHTSHFKLSKLFVHFEQMPKPNPPLRPAVYAGKVNSFENGSILGLNQLKKLEKRARRRATMKHLKVVAPSSSEDNSNGAVLEERCITAAEHDPSASAPTKTIKEFNKEGSKFNFKFSPNKVRNSAHLSSGTFTRNLSMYTTPVVVPFKPRPPSTDRVVVAKHKMLQPKKKFKFEFKFPPKAVVTPVDISIQEV